MKENKLYTEYLKKALKEHISNKERVDLFNKVTPLFLNNTLSFEEFSHIVSNLYFKKESSGIGKKDSMVDWIMYFGTDLSWEAEDYKRKLKLYYESPKKFKKWWVENIVSAQK